VSKICNEFKWFIHIATGFLKVAIIGIGFAGVVTGTCFAEVGIEKSFRVK